MRHLIIYYAGATRKVAEIQFIRDEHNGQTEAAKINMRIGKHLPELLRCMKVQSLYKVRIVKDFISLNLTLYKTTASQRNLNFQFS